MSRSSQVARNLEARIDIAAPPHQVWSVIADLRRMPEFSPQCRRTFVLGQIRTGARMVNLNREGWKVWPTSAQIVRFEPDTALAFRMKENHTVWSFELTPSPTGTTLVQRRDASAGIPTLGITLLDVMFGSQDAFDTILTDGMNTTLKRIKQAVEALT